VDTRTVLQLLGYASSPNFLTRERLDDEGEHTHVYRRAVVACESVGGEFAGVYTLRHSSEAASASTPVVYVAEVANDEGADALHQKVWNQSVVPFLIVRVDRRVRLYSGFEYAEKAGPSRSGVLEASVAADTLLTHLGDLHARSIDSGSLWRKRSVDPKKRLDRKLLSNLNELGTRLRKERLSAEIAHGLIGKFVYLRYLKDRGILSERRLEEFGVDTNVFGRRASVASLHKLVSRVDEWLNGSVFPIPLTGKHAPSEDQVSLVASIFLGDEAATGQLHLDFRAYDFSYIPIETLSVIYEQFLAAEEKQSAAGAYYTPLSLVNFLLAEMDQARPLTAGMRVLDPSCGSGAFLVQCYRRLIERRIGETGRMLRPPELREILTKHIFGVDRDGDACRVAELSLILTMLDYVDPPDLIGSRFKLPGLHGTNIFQGDFFDDDAEWLRVNKNGFDWVVGNPPWQQLEPANADDSPALAWTAARAHTQPVVRLQVAEAFAWKSAEHASADGVVGLVMPAMSLVTETRTFRDAFFRKHHVLAVANFTNLRRMLFATRAETAAAAMIYTPSEPKFVDEEFYVYSPLVVNQEVTRPPEPGVRIEPWTITVDRSEIRTVRVKEVLAHGARVWTTMMWGGNRDLRLLLNAENRCGTLESFVGANKLRLSEGPQLREKASAREPVEAVSDMANKIELDMEALKNIGRIHVFPSKSLTKRIPAARAFTRAGRASAVAVCRPPHVIVNASRTFAVYSDEFIVVPPRQVGIAGDKNQQDLLRALALYLSSDFVDYHRFLDSSQVTVRGVSTLGSLKRLPTPLGNLNPSDLRRWADLHRALLEASKPSSEVLVEQGENHQIAKLTAQLNEMVADALELTDTERWLVHDLVHVRMKLADGQVGVAATRPPTEQEFRDYADALAAELDAFVEDSGHRHQVDVVHVPHGGAGGAVRIRLCEASRKLFARVLAADAPEAQAMQRARARIEEARSQWLYFDRNLVVYDHDATVILKPAQRVWWTRSQALADADELIADALVDGGGA
jgi:methylase of polypeptide subunit release factors